MNKLFRLALVILLLSGLYGCKSEKVLITFYTGGGSEIESISIDYKDQVPLPQTPVKTGYDFVGWYTDHFYKEEFSFDTKIKQDLTIYAKWELTSYVVEFIDYDQTVLKRAIVKHNDSVFSPHESPVREGYLFTGWDGSGYSITSDKKIYAKYIPSPLGEALDAFSFSFEEGDSLTKVNGNVVTYPGTYNDQVGYYCLSDQPSIITCDRSENKALIANVAEDTEVTVTVYAYININNREYKEAKEYKFLVVKDGIPVINKETLKVEATESIQDVIAPYMDFYDETESYYFLPSKGDVELLVIPIEFPNDEFTDEEIERMKYGFFGDDTQFETLNSYYHKSSYGKLNLVGEVIEPFKAKYHYQYYETYNNFQNLDASGVDLLIEEAINYYTMHYPSLDLSNYDSEGDGYLDGVHLVYSAPINYEYRSIYWAFQYHYMPTTGSAVSWGDYALDAYVFSGIDFFLEDEIENAWTIIHETGHLLGLVDYYDYTEDEDGNIGGLGGLDMMDRTRGEHNPFSKLVLDWIEPYVVTESMTITIDRYDLTGDAVIVTDMYDGLFHDYFILSYFTPTGLNTELDLSESGLLMYHVAAQLPKDYDQLTPHSVFFQNNNSDSYYKLIYIEEADGQYDISKENELGTNDDLLQTGDIYELSYDRQQLCGIEVLNQTESTITISIYFK